MFVPFAAFAPDADPTAEGVLFDGTQNIVPTSRGYRGANDWSDHGVDSLTATCVGLWYARRTSKTNRLLAGTSTQLWERSGTSWGSLIPAAITVSAVSRWHFAQVGDITLAGSRDTQPLQFESTSATTIAAMPRYGIIDTVGDFVMIGDVVTSVTYSAAGLDIQPGEHRDRWWCSALGAYDSWTPSIALQSTTNRLTDVPGPLTAGRQLGERFVFYKNRGIWIGQYVGVPFIWEWALVTQELGTFGQGCVVPVQQLHYFIGTDDFYIYDGAQVRPIGKGMREWFFDRLQKQHAANIIGAHNEYDSLVYWYFPGPTSNAGELTEFVVFNYETGKWGCGVQSIQAAHSFLVDTLTWDQLWAGLVFNNVPNTTFDSAYFQAESFVPVFINGSKRLATLFGPHLNSALESSWYGDLTRSSLLRQVRMRWVQEPTSAVCVPKRSMYQGRAAELMSPCTMTFQSFFMTQDARWHKLNISTVGNWESPGFDAEVAPRGRGQ